MIKIKLTQALDSLKYTGRLFIITCTFSALKILPSKSISCHNVSSRTNRLNLVLTEHICPSACLGSHFKILNNCKTKNKQYSMLHFNML